MHGGGLMDRPEEILDKIDWLECALQKADDYHQHIFDVVSTVGQNQMLEHNQNYQEAIKGKIEQLKKSLPESRECHR